ncbi:serine/threonine-protein kinase [Paludisphaera rhizosphaerae]|uniref:serine/threonine-protein kinase n=1 Tax=Paludisphaera rhizosphaerae TaxID=2711216 RepID=UPI0013EC5020|nr:serine/threonine-protein kinase [Paludisphaera rhizosphaerae]
MGENASTSGPADAGRDLLLGLLALQNDFVSRDALVAAFAAWVADRSRPLGRLLLDAGALSPPRLRLLEALAAEHLDHHQGDVDRSLAALPPVDWLQAALGKLGDRDLNARLAAVEGFPATLDGDVEATGLHVSETPTRAGGRFRVVRFHRQGGLGRIFVARDEELGREVALKEIRPDKADAGEMRDRFLLEAEINAGLEHPGVVPIYSLGCYEDGRPFYAMRFVEGDSLKEAIEARHKESPRPDPDSVEMRKLLGRFIAVCQAIAFAHSKGVLHRDLKPHNVMLGRFGETLLIDWGLAKATGRRTPLDPAVVEATLTPISGCDLAPTIGVIGSPPYMSPEQASGDVAAFGPATDVYGLGAILYDLLTGRPPAMGDKVDVVLMRARVGDVPEPRSVNPNVPKPLEAVCLRALAKSPEDRYPTALALAEDVERWLADEPVTAWSEPWTARLRRWSRRHRTAVATVFATTAAGLVGLAAVAAVQSRANSDLRKANEAESKARGLAESALVQSERSRVAAEQARARAESVLAFLRDDVLAAARPEGQNGGLGKDATIRRAVDDAEPRIAETFKGQPAVEAEVRNALGMTYAYLGENPAAIRQYARALELREAALGRDDPESLTVRGNLAAAYLAVGRTAEALALQEATEKAREAKLGPDHPDVLAGRNNLAAAYQAVGRTAEAIALHEATLKAREAKLGPDHPSTLASRSNLAVTYYEAGRVAEAIALHEATLKAREVKLATDHPEILAGRNSLAAAYLESGRVAEAVALFEATLKVREAKLGADHPDTIRSRGNLAFAYQRAGRPADAVPLYEAALAARLAKLGPDHSDTIANRELLAGVYEEVGRADEALAMLRESLRTREAGLGPDSPDTIAARETLAAAAFRLGRPAEAAAQIEAALKARESVQGPEHPDVVRDRDRLAIVDEVLGRWGRAEPLRRAAVQSLAAGTDRVALASAMAALGSNLLMQERWSEAEAVLRDCLTIRLKLAPDHWSRFNTASQLGGTLMGQGRFAEAEPLVVAGYEGMKIRQASIPPPSRGRLTEAAVRLTRLYDAWNKPDQAREWKRRLSLTDLPDDPFAQPGS